MARKSRKNVGLIGLGIIGSRVAAGLRAAGYHSFVWNRTPKPAPNFVGSPAEVAEICDIIQIFVADAVAVREVVEAFGEQLGPRHVIINCATIGPEAAVQIAQAVQERGASFLDAPFTGSKGAAEKSQLVYYVGGEDEVFVRAKPVLEATSKAIVRCGRVGDASTLKVATNLITAVTTQTLAEALAIVRGAGIAPEALAAALEHNACKSGVVDLKLPKMISGDYEPHFSVKHMFKDVQIGIHMANELKLEVPLTTVVGGVLYGAICNGWGDLDFSSLYRVYSETPKPVETPALPAPETAAPGEETAKPAEETPASPPAAEVSGQTTDQPAETIETRAETIESRDQTIESAGETIEPEGRAIANQDRAIENEARATETRDETIASEPQTTDTQDRATATEDRTTASPDGATGTPQSETAIAEQKPAAEASAGNGSEEEENGLGGFLSRVFRRRGSPADK